MAWFDFWKKPTIVDEEEKSNPAQYAIAQNEGSSISSVEPIYTYKKQYEALEIVNRGVNLLVDDVAEVPCVIGDKLKTSVAKGLKKSTVNQLLNIEPNPFQDINTFKRNLIIDYLLDGNIFVYFDGIHLYHLPADKVTIHPDELTYVKYYSFDGRVEYSPSEIIHIKENSFFSIYRGVPRLKAANRTMSLLTSLRSFQDNFFRNGAVPGLVLKTPNTLSEKIKERLLQTWQLRYRPENGGRRPMILDGGLEIDAISNVNFKELDFSTSVVDCENSILKALGIPPILLDSGNNANIAPNLKLYYVETVLPIVKKLNFAFSRYFGFEIWEDTTDTLGLQPQLSEQASYFATLVNGGILTPNEARVALGKEPLGEENDDVRVPANIAGSASNPSEGGRPTESEDNA